MGKIYHDQGELAARKAALKIVAPRLNGLAETVAARSAGKTPLLYCARGGLRSLSLYQVMMLAGFSVLRLKEGYRAYRSYVNENLAAFELKAELIVMHGLTGVGKTALLHKLKAKNLPVLDLEGLAHHRGSLFGAVGQNPRSQKDFDALLLAELNFLKDEPFIFIEGESKRLGNVYLPDFLAGAMQEGYQVLVSAPLKTRVERILQDYNPQEFSPEELDALKNALQALSGRLGEKKVSYLLGAVEKKDFQAVAEALCTDYYDHYYSDSKPEAGRFDFFLEADDLEEAAECLSKKFAALAAVKT